jgi:hypothetical protein
LPDPDGLFVKVHSRSLPQGGAFVKTSAVCGPATSGQPSAISFQPWYGSSATASTAYSLLPTETKGVGAILNYEF